MYIYIIIYIIIYIYIQYILWYSHVVGSPTPRPGRLRGPSMVGGPSYGHFCEWLSYPRNEDKLGICILNWIYIYVYIYAYSWGPRRHFGVRRLDIWWFHFVNVQAEKCDDEWWYPSGLQWEFCRGPHLPTSYVTWCRLHFWTGCLTL